MWPKQVLPLQVWVDSKQGNPTILRAPEQERRHEM